MDLDAESKPYLMGSVEFLPDATEADPDGRAADLTRMLSASARAAHQRYCETAWKKGDWAEPADDTTPATLPHVLAADCLLPIADRQRLLEQTSPTERLRMVRAFLARETGLLAQLRAVPAPIATYLVEHSTN